MNSIHRVGHQRDGTCALDGLAQLTLMLGTVAAHPAGQDLAALVGEAAQAIEILFHRVGHQRDGTCALDGLAQLTLMLGTVAAHPAGQDLAAFVGEAAQAIDIFVIDVFDLIYAEAANLPAGTASSAGARPSFATIYRA